MASSGSSNLPTKEVPGSYGLPVVGAQKDNLDFLHLQGEVEFFKSRVARYNSTVFKVNFIPGNPAFPDPRGIALLDQSSFPVLLDSSKVDKTNVFTGSYKASDDFTGGYRVLSYLDTTDPKHATLKNFAFEVLKRNGRKFLPEFQSASHAAFDAAESELSSGKNKADMFAPVAPGNSTPLPGFAEDVVIRTAPLPFLLVKADYDKLCEFFQLATEMLDMGEKEFGLSREEAVHQLLFLVGMNSWFGFSARVLPNLLYRVGTLGAEFQKRLGDEIRAAIDVSDPAGSFYGALEKMPLLKSTVLEVFRFDPPVLYQYGRPREDMVVESHDAKFVIKKGQLLGGSQALVCRDPKVFEEPDQLIPDRFVGKEELQANVFWSNGRNTKSPTADDKQCAGKNFVETIARFYLVQLFARYKTFELSEDSTLNTPFLKSFARN
ncbi:allene oxide synthase, chloroplastic [Selaginella moellendorffii]|uniref:allene oxide synthase, chloroplastic n=1 Tax=Selaginella moellendorffii TaxID=88036 RepID=UPI000D1C5009|nr:allene oxide synthase, chloroplastic [Selaginella moellendorffii]|eukprot:XP_024533642.1 allene oxide synthase, chloroplastic [Selaginella moellendorffii]